MFNKKKNGKVRIFRSMFVAFLVFSIVCSYCLTANAAMATNKAKWVGNIWYGSNEPSKFTELWDQLTPENASKWASCEPQQGNYTFGTAKANYNYCKTKKIPFKFHTLIWGSQYPNWLNNISGTARKTAIENWYKAVAQNFPELDYIDVVNEAMPGHAPAPYKNDIGGDNGLYGTGWDWIVWSFEQARKYFPNSKLLINDYNVLCDNYSCIDNYLKVINILKDRKLIDGIGCQSHGLENSNPNNIKQKLDRLGATGIPVYISEFDVNVADDTTQKNKMQSIFSVFYQHSAVKGITLWGYLQGHTWVTNSYLIRNDGSERPALTWLRDYMKSQPDVTTDPPEPIDAFTQIEAENYNDQSGIQTETCTDTNGGQNIGFIENGDYAVYKNVNFGTGATSFQARVASNNANGGKIELRLDSASGTLVGTCTVPGTGGWQTYTDVKCSVSGVSDKHDLYLVFTGGSDYLLNVNWFKFLNTSTVKYGDLDGSGGVDALDLSLMKQYMLKTIKEFPSADGLKAADVDGSGGIDALDFSLIKQYLLKMIDKFPVEK